MSLVLIPSLLFSQYFGERSTDQNFETSDFFFNSISLNPFGLKNFKAIAPLLIDHPFNNLSLNPALITKNANELLFYIDYRTESKYYPEIFDYPMPLYSKFSPEVILPSPIFISETREDPQPIFSFGIITNPIKSKVPNLYLGGTYQRINKSEKFYSSPYWIYYPRYVLDAFGNKLGSEEGFPIIDKYAGIDEMTTTANIYSIFAGYKLDDVLSIGISYSGLDHLREGGLINNYNDEYCTIDQVISSNLNSFSRSRNYHHDDFSAGVIYKFPDELLAGLKVGYLKGNAEQYYSDQSTYFYQINTPDISPTWNLSKSQRNNDQSWNNSGDVYYFNLTMEKKINPTLQLISSFSYSNWKINFTNSSSILDTSYFYWKNFFQSNNQTYYQLNQSGYKLSDFRTGSGKKNKNNYSGFIGSKIDISPRIKLTLGLAYFENRYEVNSSEPVVYESKSYYNSVSDNPNNQSYSTFLRVYEDKELKWHYESVDFSYQIPVIINFIVSEKISFMILINQISAGTQADEYTEAIFRKRIRTEYDSTKITQNFIECYLPPRTKLTSEKTDLIANVSIAASNNISVSFLFNPELRPSINLLEWWFKIEGKF